MVAYRRNFIPGGTYFFTVNLRNRDCAYLTNYIDHLRKSFEICKLKYPFSIDVIVILPEHLHCLWTLPPGDANYAKRWRYIKTLFTKRLIADGVNITKDKHGQYNLWQRRYWEHTIKDEADFNNHVAYIHYNPIKHNCVTHLKDWPHSSFHRFVEKGILPNDWGKDLNIDESLNFGE